MMTNEANGPSLEKKEKLENLPKHSNLTIGGPQTVYKQTQWNCPFVSMGDKCSKRAITHSLGKM
jgi:hypothetical protein